MNKSLVINKKRGISLIVLVITIIVVVILAVAVILSIVNNNPIEQAKKAKFQSNLKTMQEELNMYISTQVTDKLGEFNIADENYTDYEDIKSKITSMTEDWKDKIIINNGSLFFTGESEWAYEILKVKLKTVTTNEKTIELSDCVASNIVNIKIYGNSFHNGTPSPDNPINLESVGDYNENTKKYMIPLKVNSATVNVPLKQPLRKLGNYTDYFELKKEVIYRKTGKWILDSNKNYILYWNKTNTYSFYTYSPFGSDWYKHFRSVYCNYFIPQGSASYDFEGFTPGDTSARLYIFVKKDRINSFSKDDFKNYTIDKYNSGNPIIFWYPLPSEKEEEIDVSPILLKDGNNTVETEVAPSKIEITYMSK